MPRFILGGDATRLRFILEQDSGVVTEEIVTAPAKERLEGVLIATWLRTQGVSWSSLSDIRVLVLPHSHTSVRVLLTIARAAAWYEGISFREVPAHDLTVDSAEALLSVR